MGVLENLYKDSEEICQMLTRVLSGLWDYKHLLYLYTSQTFFFTFSVNMLYFSDFFLHFCSEHVLISEKVSH